MTYEQAMQFWFGRINYEVKSPRPSDLSLDRMRELLRILGNPQERYLIVHVAGSKGKGSTSAMLASILRQEGYETGLFTSPHLSKVEERIQVDGTPIAAEELTRLMEEIEQHARANGLEPALTFFEVATALGFLHFARREVDVAVVEVGLGGRFDSTNVCEPFVSIITSISFDHTQYLGNTLAQIAMEKAGIVKPGRPCLSGVQAPEARTVIEEICRQRGAPLKEIGRDFHYRHEPAVIGATEDTPMRVTVTAQRTRPALQVGLIGEHQASNAALAVAAVEEIDAQGFPISDKAVAAGLAKVQWPARLEIMGRQPLVLLDCAHNVASAEALVQAIKSSLPPREAGGRRTLIFAGSNDKDLAGMLRVLAPEFDRVALTRFSQSPRAVAPEELVKLMPVDSYLALYGSALEAWQAVRGEAGAKDVICVAGSVFLAGQLRPVIGEASAKR
jgi:dihydrofolate synthase/folylpolyglutamate synthase